MSRKLLLSAVCLTLVSLTGCSALVYPSRATEERTITAEHQTGSGLEVRTDNGAVTVVAQPSRVNIEVIAKITAAGMTQDEANDRVTQIDVPFLRKDNGTLVIAVEYPEGRRWPEGCSLEVRVPDTKGVTIRTSNGAIELRGLGGNADVQTSNGNVTVVGQQGGVVARTSNGVVLAERIVGNVRVRTSNGKITINDALGEVDADTSNGPIQYFAAHDAKWPFKLKTSNGRVEARVPKSLGGTVKVDTSNGGIAVIGDAEIKGKKKNSKTITLSDDSNESTIKTSNGSVALTVEGK